MGVPLSISISGLTCGVTHGPSHAVIATTPPKDNGGDGSSFSPTDLLAAALATCALTTMALQATRESLSWGDASASVVKEMSPAPRRVAELTVEIRMPTETKPEHRARLEEIAHSCPVARSLSAEVKVPIRFVYPA
jgi:putative redox protein